MKGGLNFLPRELARMEFDDIHSLWKECAEENETMKKIINDINTETLIWIQTNSTIIASFWKAIISPKDYL